MTLKLAKASDAQDVLMIFKRAVDDMCDRSIFQWDEIYPSEQTLRQDIDNGHMYLLCCGKHTIGAIVLNEKQDEEYNQGCWVGTQPAAVVHRLCIDPEHQHKGYGKQAMQLAHTHLKERGYRSVRLDAYSQNPHALNLYESLGYNRAGSVTFRKGLFCLYEKCL